MTEEKPKKEINLKKIPIHDWKERRAIFLMIETTDPEYFVDVIKNSLREGEILIDHDISDHSSYSFA